MKGHKYWILPIHLDGDPFANNNMWNFKSTSIMQVTDYDLISGGRNIRVIEENKNKYVDLVAEHW